MATKIIFVRHGRTDYNKIGLFDCEDKARLAEEGKQQAEEIVKIFADEKIAAIYSSPLTRCIETIAPLAEKHRISIQKRDELREIHAPKLQDTKFDCHNFKWENGFGDGELIKDTFARVKMVIDEICENYKNETVVVCAHGDPTFLGRLSLNPAIDYDTEKYSCGKYLENNPQKYDIHSMYGVEIVE